MRHIAFLPALLLVVSSPAGATHDVITVASVSSAGVQANAGSSPTDVSADGRYIVFSSPASNLVTDDRNGLFDVFVRDRLEGTTVRVSVSSSGVEGNARSYAGHISDDGRFVAFLSEGSNLVDDDHNDLRDVFVHDRVDGSTIRVSPFGIGRASYLTPDVDISGDGSVVVFDKGGNFVDDPDRVLVWDRATGETHAVLDPPDPESSIANASVSRDGRYVAVISSRDLSSDGEGQGLFVVDRTTGSAVRVVHPSGPVAAGFSSPSLSADGTAIVYEGHSCGFIGGCWRDIFVTDLQTGGADKANVDGMERPIGQLSTDPSISGDGRYVAWIEHFGGSGTDHHGVFVRDLRSGGTIGIDGRTEPSWASPVVSDDGRSVAFYYGKDDLAPGDSNGVPDTLVWSSCPHDSRNDGPVTGPVHDQVSPNAGDLAFTLDALGCDVLRPAGL